MDKCLTCDKSPYFRWTDSHGIAVCGHCGTPYRLYHYENEQRVEKPPAVMLNESGLAIARQYWGETRRRVFPAAFDLGIERGGRTYSGATREDCEAWNEWADAHPDLFPPSPDDTEQVGDRAVSEARSEPAR